MMWLSRDSGRKRGCYNDNRYEVLPWNRFRRRWYDSRELNKYSKKEEDGVIDSVDVRIQLEMVGRESWSVGSEECSIMNPSLLNRLYSLSWLCGNCVLIIGIMSENGDGLLLIELINHWIDLWVLMIENGFDYQNHGLMKWLGYGNEQRSQIVDCDEWFDKICKLSVQWSMIINVYTMKQREWGLKIHALASDEWFESSSIEWWWNERMNTWGLEGIGVVEAIITTSELDSIRW